VREAEERLRDAAARLGRLEGKQVEKRNIRIIIGRDQYDVERIPARIELPRLHLKPGAPEQPTPRPRAETRPMRCGETAPPADDVVRPREGSDRRLRNLERRLEEVMRQLEMMRRDMRGPRDGERGRDRRPEEDRRERREEKAPEETRREHSRIEL